MTRPVLALVLALLAPAHGAFAACYGWGDRPRAERFELRGGEALDRKSGLLWQRCSLGAHWDGKACAGEKSWLTLEAAQEAAKAVGHGWHVPSGPELETIVDPDCGQPVVDTAVFPDIELGDDGAAGYWTTSPVGVLGLIYYFDFMTGMADGHSTGLPQAVRLVKTAP
ncbi:DUF1566 domain-containing protein [Xanthobacter autotrophicus DSM 431]|uniref:Lcl C-terminal domain-containing protein n=1 Tax=Xanthobacter nonsaccharivorans TaxID=3119912 RepID=UPI0037282232